MRVLLTGPPGVGKTTVCKSIASNLLEKNYSLDGFYTEEVRNSAHRRIGFDIIPIKNPTNRVWLARIGDVLQPTEFQKHKIGNYHVLTKNLDQVAVPTIQTNPKVLIIDEIGKMELFSNTFQFSVKNLFDKNMVPCIIATIPSLDKIPQRHVAFFNQLYSDPSNKIIHVDCHNRNKLPQEICDQILQTLAE